MSEEISKILDKFDRTLEEYELDKKVGQPSIDSIYFLYPSEMITIKNYIRQKENILKALEIWLSDRYYGLNGHMDSDVIGIKDVLNYINELKGEDKE